MFRFLPALLAAGLVLLGGCVPPSSSPMDEDRDAHVLAGRQRLLNRDIDGAISEFEQALQVNPKNATAHFELAVAYKEHRSDDASAIYHFQKCILAQPKGPRSTLAEQRARISRQDLARAEQETTFGVLDRSYRSAITTNQHLLQRVQLLDAEVVRLNALLKNLPAQQRPQPQQPTNYVAPRIPEPVPRPVVRADSPPPQPPRPITPQPRIDPPRPAPAQRTHVVKAQETRLGIAKRHGVSLEKLLAANRNVDARNLKIGQAIVIPPP